METPKGPETFYCGWGADDFGLFPATDLEFFPNWPLEQAAEFLLGYPVLRVTLEAGYGAFLEGDDIWLFGETIAHLMSVVAEWSDD